MNFNSHAHVERDLTIDYGDGVQYISTHTLTWSVTGRHFCGKADRQDFNSHAHVERDALAVYGLYRNIISTHTLTWSVTAKTQANLNAMTISTHTLTWSVTGTANATTTIHDISTHTLTWSVTLDVVYIWCLLNMMRTYFFI